MRSHLRSGATPRLAHRDRTAEPAVCPCKRVLRTLITLTGTVARERVPCQRQRCARERPTPPVRRVPDSLPGRGLRDVPRDAPCGPRCAEIRPTCSKFAPHAEICVACPRFALQRHRVMTNLPTFFLFSTPRNTFLFWNTHRDIIYILYILLFNTPRYSASVILDSGTFSDISDVLAFAKFEMRIFLLTLTLTLTLTYF